MVRRRFRRAQVSSAVIDEIMDILADVDNEIDLMTTAVDRGDNSTPLVRQAAGAIRDWVTEVEEKFYS